jgi:anaerobic selenocysteine-containing dehydrogenase
MVEPPAGSRHDWEALGGLMTRLLARGARGRKGVVAGKVWERLLPRLGAEGLLDLGLRFGPYGHPAGAIAMLDRVFGRVPFAATGWRRLLARLHQPARLPDGVPAGGLTLKFLKSKPHGFDLGPLQPRLPERLFTPDKRVQLVDPIYAADLERLRANRPDADSLVLIGRRHLRSNNSWMHNSKRLVKGKTRCTLMIHPDDAASRGLEDGATAIVSSRAGEIALPAEVTDNVMRGVVSVPHGWGHHREGVGWSTASANAGVSVNDITDEHFVDRLSGTSALSGVRVEVRAQATAEAELATAEAS